MPTAIPTLREGAVTLRPIRLRDARALERELMENRSWLRTWEATSPYAPMSFDTRASIRSLLAHSRTGSGLPFLVEYNGELAGQLNVSSITWGSLSSASIGYWVGEKFAGRSITPIAVALATDYCFSQLGLHRMEICIRPENAPSLRVVEKLGFRYEGLRRRFIHINGAWRDHFAFGMVAEEVRGGVLRRWQDGLVPPGLASVNEFDTAAAAHPLEVADK
ncbi:GNAT family N-acetyltransferase [Cryobacterium sp. LW097]|uniref:GNAT family N-acetyltransferase n=1 Tax=unclassified Cryobacterium TaxID=2649013 RepID=UPI000B4C7DB8|nr:MULTISPECIES: GNAT family protein [unclassified Cryobacterium]ASD22945.1 GNAT family N-acetyltransferase [Cryobacterium sp. LW097]TFC60116.1 N-acetyltransferase [Cryobacterium sp. TMB1-7]TFC91695.1 N-acetyltransferase [Cryobacterium sp. TMT4-31]